MRNIQRRVATRVMFPVPSKNQKEAGNKCIKWGSTPHLTCYDGRASHMNSVEVENITQNMLIICDTVY